MSIDAEHLAEPFPRELLRIHPDKKLAYVPISEVVARLNRVLGVGNWGYEVVRLWEAGEQTSDTGPYPTWVMAHVRLTVSDIDKLGVSTLDGIGGQSVKMLKSGKGPLDLGDEYKGAVSDALKKAAQHLGVGLELARKDEALAWESRQLEGDPPVVCKLCGEKQADLDAKRDHMVTEHDWVRRDDGTVAPPPKTAEEKGGTEPTSTDHAGAGHTSEADGGHAPPEATPDAPLMSGPQRGLLFKLLSERGITGDLERQAWAARELGQSGAVSFTTLTKAQAKVLIDKLEAADARQ